MPRRRNVCQHAVRSVVEALEQRQLLTTIVGGGTDPITGEPIPTTVRYKDAQDNIVQISVGGDTTAEFIFGRVTTTNNLVLGDLAPPSVEDGDGKDLFHIYVSESNSRSFITVTAINPDNGDLLPFTGNAGEFRVTNAINGQSITVAPDGPGQILLGARTGDIENVDNEDNIAIVSRSIPGAFGVRPALGSRLTAGFQVAPGQDFGSFLFGGVVTGQVTVPGTINSVYAGNMWTGDARGLLLGDAVVNSRGKKVPNFNIGGNLHSLLVGGSVGTHDGSGLDRPTFVTGFVAQVGGIVGELNTRGDWIGAVNVVHGRASSEFGVNVLEVEGRTEFSDVIGDAAAWRLGYLDGSPLVLNDTYNTPQILPSFLGRRGRSSVVANGRLVADNVVQDTVDYYAMPLIAGQSLTITLRPTGTVAGDNLMNVGVFDPDGRLILTDYSNVNNQVTGQTSITGQAIHFTADRPGLYRIAVATIGDGDFNGPGGEFAGSNIGISPYFLTVTGGEDLALGGVMAGGNIFDGQAGGFGFFVQNGDMGSLQAGGTILSVTDESINVRRGDLRSIEGGAVGVLQGNALGSGPNLYVQRGNVGLVRSTAGVLDLNNGVLALPIGGDYQIVQSATTMLVTLLANRAIGSIKAGNMATTTPSVITVNADQEGDDGIIDLIDVAGNFGVLGAGGPAITTGPGGNVRYINVGGQAFRDQFFGGGEQEATTYAPGEVVRFNDDSGTLMEFEPFPRTPNPAYVPGGTNPAQIGPTLTINAYPIRGSGGVAVMSVTSNGSLRVGAGGRRGSRAHAEIGLIETTGPGNPVIRNATSGDLVFSFPTGGQVGATNAVDLEILMDGSGTLDVFKIQGSDFTRIRNETLGEILNIDATLTPSLPSPGFTNNGTIGTLEATNIGVGVRNTGAAVNGLQTIGNVYPFNQQHNGVVSGNILNVQASGAVGNLNVAGSIGNVTANSGGRRTTGQFEGIAGPIVASDSIGTVGIGQGILPSGSGNVSRSGIYAGNSIGSVVNQRGSDIRGDIIAGVNIGSVSLSNGSIIGSKIMVVSSFDQGRRFRQGVVLPDAAGDTVSNPIYEIGEVSTGGYGGIIGSEIIAADIGDISVRRGFGIMNSFIADQGDGTINSVYAEGYGIRGTHLDGGALLNSLNAGAKPRNVSVLEFSPSVRLSEDYAIDPYFDQAPSPETDLHLFLGTSANRPKVRRVTDTGVIEDVLATASRNAGRIFASQIRSSQFNIANTINSIETRGVVDGLNLTTGRLRSYYSGDSSYALNFNVAGPIDKVQVVGELDDTSFIRALGPSGRIVDFIVDGTLNGDVSSSNSFRLLAIGKDLGATSLVTAKSMDIKRIKGGLFGTINITG
jgi:hypothetical protein